MDAEGAAGLLIEARRTGERIAELPPGARPATLADAIAVQDRVLAALGECRGWKVGARGPELEPSASPLPGSAFLAGPAHIGELGRRRIGLEAEFAFRFGRDLPPRPEPYGRTEVRAALAAVHPAIEVVDPRYVDMQAQDPLVQLADSGGNRAFVLGDGRPDRLDLHQTNEQVIIRVDGRVVADPIGGNAAGDLLRLLTWLANHAAARGLPIRAGDTVSTGSCVGLLWFEAPLAVEVEIPSIGRVGATLG